MERVIPVIVGLLAAQVVFLIACMVIARRVRTERDAAQAARASAVSAAERAERSAARALRTVLKTSGVKINA